MTTLHISLPDSENRYVEEQVVHGGFETVSDYLRHLVIEDRIRKAEEKLDTLLLEGVESGPDIDLTPENWGRLRSRLTEGRPGTK